MGFIVMVLSFVAGTWAAVMAVREVRRGRGYGRAVPMAVASVVLVGVAVYLALPKS